MKRTPLRRKTPLRAKKSLDAYHLDRLRREQKAGHRPNLRRSEVPPEARQAVIVEARSCPVCHLLFFHTYGEAVEVHHAFYRSRVHRRVRHERWNLVLLHRGCHVRAHKDPRARAVVERIAIRALYEFLGPWRIAEVLRLVPPGATDDSAFVRAYEQWSRHAA